HGAMVADDYPDVEGEILRDMRAVLGPNIPLVATLDLHANVTAQMVRHANALVLYHTAPHIDILDTGRRAAKLMERILFAGARPGKRFRWLLLPSGRTPKIPRVSVRASNNACRHWSHNPMF